MNTKPFLIYRDGHWRIVFWFGISPILFDTLPEAYAQAVKYA